MVRIKLVFLSSLLLVYFSRARKLPSYVTLCSRNDPALNACSKNSINSLRPYLIQGISEMQIPSIDPLRLPRVDLNPGDGSSDGLSAVFENLVITGGGAYEVLSHDLSFDPPLLRFSYYFPLLTIQSEYKINGRISVLELNGHGASYANFTDFYGDFQLYGEYETKHNKQYINWMSRKVDIKIGKPYVYLENIINGNSELSEQTNKILNKDGSEILSEFKPFLTETMSSVVLDGYKRIFKLYAIDELFPF